MQNTLAAWPTIRATYPLDLSILVEYANSAHLHLAGPAKDYLWLQLRDLPYFRALMRAVEASFYADLHLPQPILDVGCGDGHFVTVAFDQKIAVGVDPWAAPLREAAQRGGYRSLCRADGARMPFPDAYFESAISNSVLEHIPQVQDVLQETGRVLKPGAPFVFCVPNQRFLESLSIGRFLDAVSPEAAGRQVPLILQPDFPALQQRSSRGVGRATSLRPVSPSSAGGIITRPMHCRSPNGDIILACRLSSGISSPAGGFSSPGVGTWR